MSLTLRKLSDLTDRERLFVDVTERVFQRQVNDLAGLLGWLYYHTHRSDRSQPGFPDLVMVRRKRTIFAELKTERGVTSAPQEEWGRALVETGAEFYLWRPSMFEEILETLKRGE